MTTIYCISSGEYSDWGISYSFASKEKRDKLLQILGTDYNEYDLELYDDRIDIDSLEGMYEVRIFVNREGNIKPYYGSYNPLNDDRPKYEVYIDEVRLSSVVIPISKNDYELKDDYKWIKVYQDTEAKVKYMLSEGMSNDEIMESLNSLL